MIQSSFASDAEIRPHPPVTISNDSPAAASRRRLLPGLDGSAHAGAVEGKPFRAVEGRRHGLPRRERRRRRRRRCSSSRTASSLRSAARSRSRKENVPASSVTAGRIEVADFWFASGTRGGRGEIVAVAPTAPRWIDHRRRGEDIGSIPFEVDRTRRRSAAGRSRCPGMTWTTPSANPACSTVRRADAGPVRDERPEARLPILRPAVAAPGSAIPHRPVQWPAEIRLGRRPWVRGISPDFASASILLDAFWERGGNVFGALANIYGGGRTERILRRKWLKSRGTREGAVIGKARIAADLPDVIGRQRLETLGPVRHRPPTLLHAPRQPRRAESASSSTPWTPR